MNEKNEHSNRRQFIKSIGAFTVVGTSMSAKSESLNTTNDTVIEIPKDVDYSMQEYHICQGLNMMGKAAGTAKESNLSASDLHSCEGGNSCAGLGACGTGSYARQYWVADNLCGKEPTKKDETPIPWNGTGGCGVPIGTGNTGYISSQLNSAAPGKDADGKEFPSDFVGQPVWNIARARFEAKMVKNKKPFGVPPNLDKQPDLCATSWDGKSVYKPHPGSPPAYPTPIPKKVAPQPPLSE